MTPREKARIVAERVAARIREVSPEGLGHWEPAWELVAGPSDRLLDALAEWEAEDSPATRSEVEAASTALVRAWAEAARRWKEAGRPPIETPSDADEVEIGVEELVS